MSMKRKAKNALKKAGLDPDVASLAVEALGSLFADEEVLSSKPKKKKLSAGRRSRALEADIDEIPEEFLVEVPILVPGCVARAGNLNLFPDEIEIAEAIEEALEDWEQGGFALSFYDEDEDEEEPVEVYSDDFDGKIKVLDGERS